LDAKPPLSQKHLDPCYSEVLVVPPCVAMQGDGSKVLASGTWLNISSSPKLMRRTKACRVAIIRDQSVKMVGRMPEN
jgi:hypothetical protein